MRALRVEKRKILLGLVLTAAALSTGGCASLSVPSQSAPACSWSTSPPDNADALCSAAFKTLRSIASAEVRHDTATIRMLAPDPQIDTRILANMRDIDRKGIRNLHIVPSFTLEQTGAGLLGAGFYLGGQGRGGKYYRRETVFLRIHGQRALVVQDQPGQEW